MSNRSDRAALLAATIAARLGTASAAVSAYWALGGTALVDTVGGDIERWGRERSPGVVATLWVIVALKLVGAAAPLVLVGVGASRLPPWTRTQPARVLGWIAAIGLTLYGGVLTIVGVLVEAGALDAAEDADERPLPGTRSCGIRGSRCGGPPSPSRCGAADRMRPNKPFVTGAANRPLSPGPGQVGVSPRALGQDGARGCPG